LLGINGGRRIGGRNPFGDGCFGDDNTGELTGDALFETVEFVI
jgi:hypothetical protein